MNYPDLIAQIQSLCNREDPAFVAQIPNFITRAIYRIYNKVKTIGIQAFAEGNLTFTIGSPFIDKPVDWQETISLSYVIPGTSPTRVYLLPRSYEFCKTYNPLENLYEDPIFYADYNLPTPAPGRIFLCPTPPINYTYELIYLKLPNFNATTQQDFIANRYPTWLLYESAVEAALYLKDDERIATLRSICKEESETALINTNRSYTDRTGQRNKD